MRPSFEPKRSLGQNFLVDDNIARKIVVSMDTTASDVVIEIGPGKGALTKHLAGCVRHLIAVELDKRAADHLRAMFKPDAVTILNEDILGVSFRSWREQFGEQVRIVGNIPYHLTSPILLKLFEEHNAVSDATIMVQKEVAERIAARPGSKANGILSVFSSFYGVPKVQFSVSPNCFFPRPKVTSAVVRINLNDRCPYDVDEDLLKTVVRTGFGKRRKVLRNSLKYLPFEERRIEKILSAVTIPPNARAEELTVEQWVLLTNEIEQCN